MTLGFALAIAARLFTAALSFFLLPLYARLFAPDTFGALAVQTTLVGLASLFIPGLSQSAQRASHQATGATLSRSIWHSLERLLLLGLSIGGICELFALLLTDSSRLQFLQLEASPLVLLIGLALSAITQGAISFYESSLYGQGRTAFAGTATLVFLSTRSAAGVACAVAAPTRISLFFLVQCLVQILYCAYIRRAVAERIGPPDAEHPPSLRQGATQSVGFAGSSLLSVLQLQLPSLTFVALLGSTATGRLNLVTTLAGAIVSFVAVPAQQALFNPIAKAFLRARELASEDYISIAVALAVLVFPVAGTIVVLPTAALSLWLHAAPSPQEAHALSIYAVAGAFQAALTIPYAALVATLPPRMAFRSSLQAIAFGAPVLVALVYFKGLVGSASYALALQLFLAFTLTRSIHRHAGPLVHRRWLGRAIVVPLAAALLGAATARALAVSLGWDNRPVLLLTSYCCAATLCLGLSFKEIRPLLRTR